MLCSAFLESFCRSRKFSGALIPNCELTRKIGLTTKCTKDTKGSDIDIFKLLNFVLFVTFVVKFVFSSLVAALLRCGRDKNRHSPFDMLRTNG